MYSDQFSTAAFNLPVLSLNSHIGEFFYTAEFELPGPNLTANLYAAVIGTAVFNLPVLTLSATLNPAIFMAAEFLLPVLTLESEFEPGINMQVVFDLPVPALSATMLTGHVLSAEFRLPVLTLTAGMNDGAVFNLPVITLEASLLTGRGLTAEFSLPVLSVSGTMSSTNPLDAAFNLPVVTLLAQMVTGTTMSAAFNLPVLRVASTLAHGTMMTAAFNLPVLTLDARAGSASIFTAEFVLPVTQLDARLLANIAANYRTWVLNTRKSALTEYDFEFTGYAVFNGQVLAVSPTGVVVLGTQARDDTTAIAARVRTAKSDFGTRWLKRVPRIYSGLQADGDMIFRTVLGETGTRSYLLSWLHVEDYTARRVPVGKGPKARFWQFEWANVDGSDFSVKDLLIYPTVIGRLVQ